jgi:hypothetical protein
MTVHHHCHVPGCTVTTAPKLLTCPAHWKLVPEALEREVYLTVNKRGRVIDASWAPWWRAQAKAIHAIMQAEKSRPREAREVARARIEGRGSDGDRTVMIRGGDSASHRASREIGEAFEVWVNEQHEDAGLRGALAHVVHNMPPSKHVHGRLMYEEAGVADFTGVLHGGGYFASEAKSVAPGGRLAKSRISAKQREHLDAVTACGGNSLAFLLVEFRVSASIAHRRYAIPWREVPWKVLKTAESLDEGDIAIIYQVTPGTDYLARFHKGSDRRYTVGEKLKSRVYRTE